MSGAFWAIVASVAIAATHAATRMVDLHPFLIAFWRNLFCLILVLPVALPKRAWHRLPGALPRHVARGVVTTIAMVLLIEGLNRMPLAEATALTFATPIFVVIGGALFLRERPGPVTTAAALLGLAGVLLVAPPGPGWLGSGGAILLISAALYAAAMLISRSQTRYADTLSILFYLYIVLAASSVPLAVVAWEWPDWHDLAGVLLISVCAVAAHTTIVVAMRRSEASAIAPYDYLRLVWAGLMGLALFGEKPSLSLVAGSTLIVAAALLPVMARRFRRLA